MKFDGLWRKVLLVLLLLLLIWVGYRVKGVILVVLAAFMLAYILEPIVIFMQAHRFSRTGAIVTVYALLFMAAVAAVLVAIPRIAVQLTELQSILPVYLKQLQQLGQLIQEQAARFHLPQAMYEALQDGIHVLGERMTQSIGRGLESMMRAAGSLLDIFLVPVLSFYLLKDKALLQEQLWRVLPLSWHEDLERLWREIDQLIRHFLLGNVIVSLIVAAIVTVGLSIIGMDFALVCGLLVGALNIVPYFGAVIGAIPAVMLALFTSVKQAAAVIVVMIIAQQLESDVITPKIIGEKIGVHPIAVILGILIWGKLWGIWGVLLAVPATAVVKVLLGFLLEKLIASEGRQH